ncbi:class A beta-lactamase [Paludibaculum fermentans]|uniref:class A beta-lactamase n=1 Tax=Paludibaculum fermentans TaxID=1473598 RepID=UPI003EBD343C
MLLSRVMHMGLPLLLLLLQSPSDFEHIARQTEGKLGMAAEIVETGSRLDFHSTDRFPMQSVYKFPIAMAVLQQVDQGRLRLDQSIRVEKADLIGGRQRSPIRDMHPDGGFNMSLRDLLRYAVSESDGSASDVLLRVIGGASKVQNMLKGLGIQGIKVVDTEKSLGSNNQVQYRNWAQPEAMVQLLKLFQQGKGLSKASRALLLQWMTETETGLKRLKGNLPPGTVVAHKTGTSNTVNGVTAATNDVGLITLPNGQHLAIAVFVMDSPLSQDTRERAIAAFARLAFTHFTTTTKSAAK